MSAVRRAVAALLFYRSNYKKKMETRKKKRGRASEETKAEKSDEPLSAKERRVAATTKSVAQGEKMGLSEPQQGEVTMEISGSAAAEATRESLSWLEAIEGAAQAIRIDRDRFQYEVQVGQYVLLAFQSHLPGPHGLPALCCRELDIAVINNSRDWFIPVVAPPTAVQTPGYPSSGEPFHHVFRVYLKSWSAQNPHYYMSQDGYMSVKVPTATAQKSIEGLYLQFLYPTHSCGPNKNWDLKIQLTYERGVRRIVKIPIQVMERLDVRLPQDELGVTRIHTTFVFPTAQLTTLCQRQQQQQQQQSCGVLSHLSMTATTTTQGEVASQQLPSELLSSQPIPPPAVASTSGMNNASPRSPPLTNEIIPSVSRPGQSCGDIPQGSAIVRHSDYCVGMLHYVRLTSHALSPVRTTPLAAGVDLYSPISASIPAWGQTLIYTDLALSPPRGCYIRIAARSGLALNHAVTVQAGVVDADYRGNVGILLVNLSPSPYSVKRGDRIGQIICERITYPTLKEVSSISSLPATRRLSGGFGSSGVR